jgi:hypothetical protein
MCFFRVSSFFVEITQQIHSFRARGVMSAHKVLTLESDSIALRKSPGNVCGNVTTSLLEVFFFSTLQFYHFYLDASAACIPVYQIPYPAELG